MRSCKPSLEPPVASLESFEFPLKIKKKATPIKPGQPRGIRLLSLSIRFSNSLQYISEVQYGKLIGFSKMERQLSVGPVHLTSDHHIDRIDKATPLKENIISVENDRGMNIYYQKVVLIWNEIKLLNFEILRLLRTKTIGAVLVYITAKVIKSCEPPAMQLSRFYYSLLSVKTLLSK